jgi:hypothetical protein
LLEKRILGLAYLLSLLLHIVLAGVLWWAPAPEAAVVVEAADPEIEVFLVPDEEAPADPADPQMPTQYTSIPDRQAVEEPPEDPQFLSLHHSTAADRMEGGEGNTPTAEETWITPKVEIRKEDVSGSEGVQYAQQPLPETRSGRSPQETGRGGQDAEDLEAAPQPGAGLWDLPDPLTAKGQESEQEQDAQQEADQPNLEDWWGGESPSILKEGKEGSTGDRGFDFNQEAKGSMGSGVAIDGDFSLNTYEWNYGPWMRRFENELHRHWVAPYAYRLGVINGKTIIKLVIEKDGRPSTMEIVETDGHHSLHDASLAALKAFAPYAPLPAHFPEENLVITLGLHYPAWR